MTKKRKKHGKHKHKNSHVLKEIRQLKRDILTARLQQICITHNTNKAISEREGWRGYIT